MSEKIYLPGLNGIRAMAAMSVVITHINNRLDYFSLPKGSLLDLASYGVTVFFTLSGFLITYLLLIEIDRTGTIDVKKFYMRRVLRIWPLYYLYIILVLILNGVSNIESPILFYLFIVPNLKNSLTGIVTTKFTSKILSFMLGHYWSLGVEEQFYAFWPWVAKKTKVLLKFLIIFPIFYVLLKLILRITHAPNNLLLFVNYTRFGCLTIGALGAYIYFNYKDRLLVLNNKIIEISAWIFFIVVGFNKFHLTSIIDHEIVSFFTLIIIFNQINNKNNLISLENKIFDFLGKISFGLYVYNPLIIYLISIVFSYFTVENFFLKLFLIYVISITAIILIAYLSYTYFEKRFLKLKFNYTTIKSAASRTESES